MGGDGGFNLNLTPLLDVVLQLITFFMMLIHFGTKLEGATKAVRLPVAPAALPGADLSFVVARVNPSPGARLTQAPTAPVPSWRGTGTTRVDSPGYRWRFPRRRPTSP